MLEKVRGWHERSLRLTRTAVCFSENAGRQISLVLCPWGPSITPVSNLGWLPTKCTWGHSFSKKGSWSTKGKHATVSGAVGVV